MKNNCNKWEIFRRALSTLGREERSIDGNRPRLPKRMCGALDPWLNLNWVFVPMSANGQSWVSGVPDIFWDAFLDVVNQETDVDIKVLQEYYCLFLASSTIDSYQRWDIKQEVLLEGRIVSKNIHIIGGKYSLEIWSDSDFNNRMSLLLQKQPA